MAALWANMAGMFGAIWKNNYGPAPDKTWTNGLIGFSVETIIYASKMVEESGKKFPPSFPEFKELCQRAPAPENYRQLEYSTPPEELNEFSRHLREELTPALKAGRHPRSLTEMREIWAVGGREAQTEGAK